MSPEQSSKKQLVIQTAADILNTEGLEALTIGRLAEALGLQPASLYNHIVDGLPGLMRELSILNAHNLANCLRDAAIGQSRPDQIWGAMHAMRAYIKESPGLYLSALRMSGSQLEVDPELEKEGARSEKIGMAIMASYGLQGEAAIHALRGMRSIVHGFSTLEITGGFGMQLDLDESFSHLVNLFIAGLQKLEG